MTSRTTRFLGVGLVVGAIAFCQVSPTNVTTDGPFQSRYVANLPLGQPVINLTNTGARGAGNAQGTSAATTGALCANIYVSLRMLTSCRAVRVRWSRAPQLPIR